MRVRLFDLQRLDLLAQLLRRPPHPAHLIALRGLRRFCTPVLRIHVPPHLLRGRRKPAGQQCALSLQRQRPKLQPLRRLHAAQIILVRPVLLLHARRPAVFLLRNLPGNSHAISRFLRCVDRIFICLKRRVLPRRLIISASVVRVERRILHGSRILVLFIFAQRVKPAPFERCCLSLCLRLPVRRRRAGSVSAASFVFLQGIQPCPLLLCHVRLLIVPAGSRSPHGSGSSPARYTVSCPPRWKDSAAQLPRRTAHMPSASARPGSTRSCRV